jgi:hypothetical protein
MSTSSLETQKDLRKKLALSLGFSGYSANPAIDPYLIYVIKQHIGNTSLEVWVELFVDVIAHFQQQKGSIQALIDIYTQQGYQGAFSDTKNGDPERRKDVEDTVLYMLGVWSTMRSSFVKHKAESRKITSAYRLFAGDTTSLKDPFGGDLCELISRSGLLPGERWDCNMEFEGDPTTRLLRALLTSTSTPGQAALRGARPYSTGSTSTISSMCYHDSTSV